MATPLLSVALQIVAGRRCGRCCPVTRSHVTFETFPRLEPTSKDFTPLLWGIQVAVNCPRRATSLPGLSAVTFVWSLFSIRVHESGSFYSSLPGGVTDHCDPLRIVSYNQHKTTFWLPPSRPSTRTQTTLPNPQMARKAFLIHSEPNSKDRTDRSSTQNWNFEHFIYCSPTLMSKSRM